MTAVLPLERVQTRPFAWPRWAPLACVLALSAAFMFLDSRPTPIQLWDESRVVVNALEMRAHGLSLVTTWGDRPDLWNTKPPLLVWAMQLSMALFGVSEASLRLPAGLAALALVAVVFGFVRRLSGSAWTAALAAGLLVASFGFSGLHSARTADYDAPLALFVTAYAAVLFFAVHRARARWASLMLAAGLIAAAVMTKSVAGLYPGLGIGLYLLLVGRWRRPLHGRWAVAGGAALLPVAVFLAAREHAAPGYLHAALFNDVSGRFGKALDQHAGSPLYYLALCFGMGMFSAGAVALAAPLALLRATGRVRLGLVFSLAMAAAILGVDSLASTKLPQYAVPAYPFLAMACALAVQVGFKALAAADPRPRRMALVLFAVVLAGIGARGGWLRYVYLPTATQQSRSQYGAVFQALAQRGVTRVRVLDGGIYGISVPPDYTPQLRAYILMWKPRGLDAARSATLAEAVATPGAAVATCDPRHAAEIARTGGEVMAVQGCVALMPKLEGFAQGLSSTRPPPD